MFNKTEQEIMQNWKGNLSKPIVSVCCITYNHEKYISEAIDSFLMQETDFSFEIIIGEDCSTDKTRSIIENYVIRYPNIIKLITSKDNVGMNRNFKRVAEACIGKYVALCEGDDYWAENKKLQLQKDFLDLNDEYSLCYHNFYILKDKNLVKNNDNPNDTLDLDQYAEKLPNIQTLTVMFRNIMNNIIPDEFLDKVTGSHFIFLRLAEKGKLKYINEYMSVYRIHANGIWSKQSQFNKSIMSLENVKAMINYYNQNLNIKNKLEHNYNCKLIYYILFFLIRFRIVYVFRLLKKIRKISFQKCYLSYPFEIFNSVKNRLRIR